MAVRSTLYPGGVETLLRCPKMREEIRKRAQAIKNRAIHISPVRTGHYKKSWHYRTGIKNGKAWARVYNTAHYAWFLEKGTRYMRRQRILARAVAAARRG